MGLKRCSLAAAAAVAAMSIAPACGASPTAPQETRFTFTATPVDLGPFPSISQSGYKSQVRIQPWVDFFTSGGSDAIVRAPAGGTVLSVIATADVRERVRVELLGAGGYRFYVNGLESATVAAGQVVAAGAQIGIRGRNSRFFEGVGLGVINSRVSGLFANPARYPDQIRYAEEPLQFYDEPLRSTLRALVTPAGAQPAVSYDVPGRLLGLWYLPSVPQGASLAAEYQNDRLSFFYTFWEAGGGKLRAHWSSTNAVSQGNPIGPDPRTVSAASGLVRYEVPLDEDDYLPRVFLLVEMTSDTSLRFEAFDAFYTPNPTGFTGNARTYVR